MSAHASRAPSIPTCTPPSTPLLMPAERVSATNAPGSASQPLRSTRASARNVVSPGAR